MTLQSLNQTSSFNDRLSREKQTRDKCFVLWTEKAGWSRNSIVMWKYKSLREQAFWRKWKVSSVCVCVCARVRACVRVCVCVCVCDLLQSLRVLFFSFSSDHLKKKKKRLILLHVIGLVLRRRNGTERTHYYYHYSSSSLSSLSPDVILCGWLGLKHQLTN